MLGETELFGDINQRWQEVPLGAQIQVVLSSASIPLKSSDFDISMRELSESNITWQLPPRQPHLKVTTPDLSTLLEEVRHVPHWSEASTITLVLTPSTDREGYAERIFKAPDRRTETMAKKSKVVVNFFIFCVIAPMMLVYLQHNQHFQELQGAMTPEKLKPQVIYRENPFTKPPWCVVHSRDTEIE